MLSSKTGPESERKKADQILASPELEEGTEMIWSRSRYLSFLTSRESLLPFW